MTSRNRQHPHLSTVCAAAALAAIACAITPGYGDGSRGSLPSRGVIGTRDPEAFRQPVAEVRGMWVVRNSITSHEKITNVVAAARKYGFNTLFVQVRGRGDAYYASSLEPRAEELAGQPASFDPLADIIQQAHASGIQVHAWLNTNFVWSGTHKPLAASQIVNAHPSWIARRQDGSYSTVGTDHCEGAFLSPSDPAVRQHNHDVYMEVARNYDVDGIHFDYIRYPNENYDFGAATVARFCADCATAGDLDAPKADAKYADQLAFLRNHGGQWADWRRQQVTTEVEWISKDAHALKPWIVVSAAVFADWKEAYSEKGQDWKRWLADGALDAVVPMAYGADTDKVTAQIQDAEQTAAAAGRFCYAGIGAWHIPADSTLAKISAARALGAQGFVLFSYGGVTNDGESAAYLDKVTALSFQHPATMPVMSWIGKRSDTNTASGG